jgi:thioredoxin 1
MHGDYLDPGPSRAELDALEGPLLLEFGRPTCGHCRRAAPLVAQALAAHPEVRHLKVLDESGRPLGRSFAVTLWPTLILLERGRELARVVRPQSAEALAAVLRR